MRGRKLNIRINETTAALHHVLCTTAKDAGLDVHAHVRRCVYHAALRALNHELPMAPSGPKILSIYADAQLYTLLEYVAEMREVAIAALVRSAFNNLPDFGRRLELEHLYESQGLGPAAGFSDAFLSLWERHASSRSAELDPSLLVRQMEQIETRLVLLERFAYVDRLTPPPVGVVEKGRFIDLGALERMSPSHLRTLAQHRGIILPKKASALFIRRAVYAHFGYTHKCKPSEER